MTCLDLGSGSGILSIAALRLGAKSAIGVDIDPKAEDIARENANCTDCVDLPICSLIGFTNKEKEYTEPIAP